MAGNRLMMTGAVLVRELDIRVQEASTIGCLIESASPLAIGTIGMLELEFANERRVEWFRVCRVHPARAGSSVRVFGVEFLPVAVAGGDSLRGAIGRMRPVGTLDGKPRATGRSSADGRNRAAAVGVQKSAVVPGSAKATGKPGESWEKVVSFRQRALRAKGGNEVALTDGQDAPGVRGSAKLRERV